MGYLPLARNELKEMTGSPIDKPSFDAMNSCASFRSKKSSLDPVICSAFSRTSEIVEGIGSLNGKQAVRDIGTAGASSF